MLKTTPPKLHWHSYSYNVAVGVPIPNEQGDVTVGLAEGDWHSGAVVDGYGAIPAGSSLQAERGEVEETADLVLELELVGPVPSRWDRAVGARNAILPRVHPHLDSIPAIAMEKRVSTPVQLQQKENKIGANASSVTKVKSLQKKPSCIKHFYLGLKHD
jgi:hypothetical protein